MKSGFYKSKYFIAFYSLDEEELLYTFDNVREMKRKNRLVKFLTGKPMKINIYDTEEN